MSRNILFLQATAAELMQGYRYEKPSGRYQCVFCGYETEQGRIYPEKDYFYDAKRYITIHIEMRHGSPLKFLLRRDKRWTGLTELQTCLIEEFAAGAGDQEIATKLDIGSVSSIRNHRFILREKIKQARVFLAIGELMEQQSTNKVEKRSETTKGTYEAETQKILATYFPQGVDGPLSIFPTREKRRLILLRQIATRFSSGQTYTEKEVNTILEAVYEDHVLIRRLLIDYKFLSRRPDGSEYRLNETSEMNGEKEAGYMEITAERKKELVGQYKGTPRSMGVFQIRNTANGRVFLLKAMDIPGIINRHQLELKRGIHRNQELQADWNRYGDAAFSFDVLETLEPDKFQPEQWSSAVKSLLELWCEKLQPYGDAGYNLKPLTLT